MTIDRNLSIKIRRLSLLCALLVVVIHSLTSSIGESFFQDFVIRSLTQGAVPFFFVVSGFFYFNSFDLNWRCAGRKILSRIKTLLIPFFLWVFIAVLCSRYIHGKPFPESLDRWIYAIGFPGFWPHVLPPLWYVMMLIYLSIAALPIGLVVKRTGLLLPACCAVWYMFQLRAWIYPHAACFFSLGCWAAMNGEKAQACLEYLSGWRLHALAGISVALALFRVLPIRSALSGSVYYCAVIEIAFALSFILVIWKGYDRLHWHPRLADFVDWMSQYSFFIYCSHYLFVAVPLEYCMFKAAFMLACALALGVSLKAFLPRVYSMLTGGR